MRYAAILVILPQYNEIPQSRILVISKGAIRCADSSKHLPMEFVVNVSCICYIESPFSYEE